MRAHVAGRQLTLGEEAVARHDRFRHHRARVLQMLDVPFVRIAAADAREVRPGALRAPLERVVVHALGGEAVVAVALDLVAERADHLAVAAVAALADIDVAAGELERRIGPHSLDLLDGRVDPEQRCDLDDSADRDHQQRQHRKEGYVALDAAVIENLTCHDLSYSAATAAAPGLLNRGPRLDASASCGSGRSASGLNPASVIGFSSRRLPRMVCAMFHTMIRNASEVEQPARRADQVKRDHRRDDLG